MAPRRGGEAGAGAAMLLSGGKRAFEPPPLKRMLPWQQDGAGQCDIVAGGVDESGSFKGVYLTGMHMLALLRTFQLSKAFMPVDTGSPLQALGQNLRDGIPLVVITRGCFGRDLDYGLGPIRNDVQKSVWDVVRQMRADMPQVLITCIDLPVNCSSDLVQVCLEEPLNQYRELMYHEGTWYTPAVFNSAAVSKWKEDYKQQKLGSVGENLFSRKKFSWMDEKLHYKDIWTLGWKPVLEVKPAPQVPLRIDLDFTADQPRTADIPAIEIDGQSNAHAALKKAVIAAREADNDNCAGDMLQAVKAYMERAQYWDRAGLTEAVVVCKDASERFKKESKQLEAFDAMATAIGATMFMQSMDEALAMASDLKSWCMASSSSDDGALAKKAAQLLLDCFNALGDLDKALEVAIECKNELVALPKSHARAWGLVVNANLARGDTDGALAAASEAVKAPEKVGQAEGQMLIAQVQLAKAMFSSDDAQKTQCWRTSISAQKEAKAIFSSAGKKEEEARCLETMVNTLMLLSEHGEALELAKELQAFGDFGDFGDEAGRFPDQDMIRLGALGSQLIASVHQQDFEKNGAAFRLPGGQDAMMSAAKRAVKGFEKIGDSVRRRGAQQVLLQARRCKHVAA